MLRPVQAAAPAALVEAAPAHAGPIMCCCCRQHFALTHVRGVLLVESLSTVNFTKVVPAKAPATCYHLYEGPCRLALLPSLNSSAAIPQQLYCPPHPTALHPPQLLVHRAPLPLAAEQVLPRTARRVALQPM